MGGSASKAARSTPRTYPSRSHTPNSAPSATPRSTKAQQPSARDSKAPLASATRDDAINRDAFDPQLASQLRHLGAVHPASTLSHSSTASPQNPKSNIPGPGNLAQNPAITLLQARDSLAQKAEREFLEAGKRGHSGREFLDVVQIRQVLMLRDEKRVASAEIERQLGLKKGVVDRLGSQGIVAGL